MKAFLIGIDCATVDEKVGLAVADLDDAEVRVREVFLCSKLRSAAAGVSTWLSDAAHPALIAIDAPLGWPISMATALIRHRAGENLDAQANQMFRRETDLFVRRELGKTPLDVGADRIARTAHAALRLLGEVRENVGQPLPLAWDSAVSSPCVIEVYPAATLVAHGIKSSGYKAKHQISERREIIASLRDHILLDRDASALEASADAVDAVVCILAAKDFLEGRAMSPINQTSAEKEGWIWVAPRHRP